MKLRLCDAITVVIVVGISLVSLTSAASVAGMDHAADKRSKRGFDSPSESAPFSPNQDQDMIDWNAFFSGKSRPYKRQMESYVGGFGSSNGLDNGKFQNWNDYFARNYRAFNPSQRSGGLGGLGGFGTDGLQNWRAFFDHSQGRRFRK